MIRSARFARLLAGAAGIPVAMVTSLVVFRLVRHFSVDMPIEPGEFSGWGVRWGLLLAILLTSAASWGERRPASPHQLLVSQGLAALLLLALLVLAACLTTTAVNLGLLGQGWTLSSRSGMAVRLAAEIGLYWLGLPVAVGVGLRLLALRRPALR